MATESVHAAVRTLQPLRDGTLITPNAHASDMYSVAAVHFQATPEYISQASTACTTTADEIWQDLGVLQQYIAGMEEWWQGIAANTFQELMVEYTTFSQMLYNALTDIGLGLQGNFVNYRDTEHANIQTITSIQQSLPSTNLS
jgi:WXG100 family type VII secretion target